jgi:hypothetical protein
MIHIVPARSAKTIRKAASWAAEKTSKDRRLVGNRHCFGFKNGRILTASGLGARFRSLTVQKRNIFLFVASRRDLKDHPPPQGSPFRSPLTNK